MFGKSRLLIMTEKLWLSAFFCLVLIFLMAGPVFAETVTSSTYNTAFFYVEPLPKTAECLQCHAGGGPNSSMHSIITMAQNTLANAVNIPGSGWFLTEASLNSDPATLHASHATNRWSGTWCIQCHRTPLCTDCHNNTVSHSSHQAPGSPPGDCASCHQNLPKVVTANADGTPLCINCHNSGTGLQGDHKATSDLPVTCSGCHDGIKAKGAFNTHDQAFVDISGAAIHPTCTTCHGSADTTVKGFVYSNLSKGTAVYKCDECHTSVEPGPPSAYGVQVALHNEDHTVNKYYTNPVPGALWPDGQCSNCHNKDVTFAHQHPSNRRGFDCDNCHGPNPVYPNTGNVINANLSNNPIKPGYKCQDCHTEATLPNHTHEISLNGYEQGSEIDCSSCHAKDLYGEHRNQHTGWTDYIQRFGCNTCHNSTFDGSIIQYDYTINLNSVYCATCHNGSTAPVKETMHKPSHLSQFSGADLGCSTCHTFPAAGTNADITSPALHKKGCVTCHGVNTRYSVKTIIQGHIGMQRNLVNNPSPSCTYCHGDNLNHQVKHEGKLDTKCLECHDQNISDEHTNHPKRPTGSDVSCAACHESTRPDVKRAINLNKLECGNCHKNAHNTGLADNLQDIPLYPGFQWTTPLEPSIFKGDKDDPGDTLARGLVIMSNRQKGITPTQVWDFYSTELKARGWNNVSYYAPAANGGFVAAFGTERRGEAPDFYSLSLRVSYIATQNDDFTGPVLDGGKIKIWYAYQLAPRN